MRQASYREGLAGLLSMSPAEAELFARRTAEIADEHNDLGMGIRCAMAEMLDAREAPGGDA